MEFCEDIVAQTAGLLYRRLPSRLGGTVQASGLRHSRPGGLRYD